MAKAIGLTTSREVWIALENTFSHRSKAHEIHFKDDLQLMKCSTRPVSANARAFKGLCDQLHAIDHPVDGTDKVHRFLHGLGPNFSSFSFAHMAQTPFLYFSNMVSKAESFEIFQKSLEPSTTSTAAFTANWASSPHFGGSSHPNSGRGNGHGRNSSHGQSSHSSHG
ncbi:uncharacterized protein [Aristolochia californica]|uniref:uncharacterized protein n=1 Tax=Aristolochia californica TaxID=171875 RepID=UPI0035E1F011